METDIDVISVATDWLLVLFQKAKQQRFCPKMSNNPVCKLLLTVCRLPSWISDFRLYLAAFPLT